MEKLQTTFQRLKAISAAADPTQRMLIMAVPTLLAVGILVFTQVTGPTLVPLTVADGTSIAQAMSKLADAGLPDAQHRNGQIVVPADQLQAYSAALAENPADQPTEWEQQFSKASIFTTKDQLQAAKDIALEKRIRRTLLAVPTIQDATVTWARSERRRWGGHVGKVTATVGITPRPNSPLTSSSAGSIRMAVANMIADLQPDDVTIFDQSTGEAIGNEPGPTVAASLLQNQTEVFRSRIQDALTFLPNTTVSVTAEPAVTAQNGSTDKTTPAVHVAIQTAPTSYQSLAASEATQARVRCIVRQTIEPAYELSSLKVTRTAPVAIASAPVSQTNSQPAWLIPLIAIGVFFAVTAIAKPIAKRNPVQPSPTQTTRTTQIQQPADVIDEQVDHVDTSQLNEALRSHPHESLTVLQRWATTSSPAAATVANQMEPTLAAQFAQRMSDDERTQLHEALQQQTPTNVHSTETAIADFCEQVAAGSAAQVPKKPPRAQPTPDDTAQSPATVTPPATPPTRKPTQRPKSRLYEFPPRLVAQMLESEKPQTVAIALAQLDERTLGRVLRNFSLAQSDKVRERLPLVNSLSPDIRNSVESAVLDRIRSMGQPTHTREVTE